MSPVYKPDVFFHRDLWTRVRIRFVGGIFVLLLSIVVARAFYLQVIASDKLTNLARKQQRYIISDMASIEASNNDIISKDNYPYENLTLLKDLFIKQKSLYDISIFILALLATMAGLAQVTIMLYQLYKANKVEKLLVDNFGNGPFSKESLDFAIKYYVPTKCMDFDPCNYEEIRSSLNHERQLLHEVLDDYIYDDISAKYMMILADSGMGKSTFLLNYYAYNAWKSSKKRVRLLVVPLIHNNADSYISECKDKADTVLLLDGLDEDSYAIKDQSSRFNKLVELTIDYYKVVITCRSQFYYSDDSIPTNINQKIYGPRKLGEKAVQCLRKTYIAPFDDYDVKTYLNKYYSFINYDSKARAYNMVKQIPYLHVRPMLLSYIPDLVNKDFKFKNTANLYENIIDGWLERETEGDNKSELYAASELIAIDIYVGKDIRGIESVTLNEIGQLINDIGIDLADKKFSSRSLLNRDSEGNYKFAHRSIMEYLFIKSAINGNKSCCNILLTDLMMRFFLEIKSEEWQLDENLVNNLVKRRFAIKFLDNVDIFNTRSETARSIANAINYSQSVTRKNAEFEPNQLDNIMRNESLVLLLRDLALSYVDCNGKHIYDNTRTDAFWLRNDFRLNKITHNKNYKRYEKWTYFTAMPLRERIGVYLFLNMIVQSVGVEMLEIIIHLAQNELSLSHRANDGLIVLSFVPLMPHKDEEANDIPTFLRKNQNTLNDDNQFQELHNSAGLNFEDAPYQGSSGDLPRE